MLYLLPNLLDVTLDPKDFLPPSVEEIIQQLDGVIVESEKLGRQFLQHFIKQIQKLPIRVLNEHTTAHEVDQLAAPMQRGETWGLLSDAGLPVLADPGAQLIRCLNGLKIPVQTFPGPCSMIYALQLSGLSAQAFTFHGYFSRKPLQLEQQLKMLASKHTHVFIEAPYRTDKVLRSLVSLLPNESLLCVASNLTLPTQSVRTHKVAVWKKHLPVLGKVPTVFLIRKENYRS